MTRKLFSMLLCAFALLLLMGAGVAPQQQTATMLAEEESVSIEESIESLSWNTLQTDIQSVDEVSGDEEVLVEAESEQAEPVEENIDYSLLIDGAYAQTNLGKDQKNGVTYVALAAIAQVLDETAQVNWDANSGTVVITTSNLKLTAKVGQVYLEANGRYLYLPETVQLVDGRVTVPLWAVAKAFDATVGWDGTTGTVSITRGSGAIQSGDSFYSSENLFWLSRLIYAESSGEPLKGMIAVGNVVQNRVASPIFPNSIKDVLSQKNQFSTYKNGKLANRTPDAVSIIAAKLVMDGAVVDETAGALYFDSTPNSWASRNKTCIAIIGGHKFYR